MAYVEIGHYNSRMEAETIGHALDQFNIPFLIQAPDVGIYGPGMTGFSPQGAALCVPEELEERARELLRCAVNVPEVEIPEGVLMESVDGDPEDVEEALDGREKS